MKTKKEFLLFIIRYSVVLLLIYVLFSFCTRKNNYICIDDMPSIVDTVYREVFMTGYDMEALYDAICFVESGNSPDAKGPTDDLGIIQITPVYVKEVNRILGEERYSLEDRLCPEKSREMFEVYQRHHNPERDFVKTIYLHNPRARMGYAMRIEEEYKRIVNEKKNGNF